MFLKLHNIIFFILFSIAAFGATTVSLQAAEKSSPQQIPVLTVNINTASAEELADVLTGVGIKKARTIVAHREKSGAFKTVDDLLAVKGIGTATLEKNRHKLKL